MTTTTRDLRVLVSRNNSDGAAGSTPSPCTFGVCVRDGGVNSLFGPTVWSIGREDHSRCSSVNKSAMSNNHTAPARVITYTVTPYNAHYWKAATGLVVDLLGTPAEMTRSLATALASWGTRRWSDASRQDGGALDVKVRAALLWREASALTQKAFHQTEFEERLWGFMCPRLMACFMTSETNIHIHFFVVAMNKAALAEAGVRIQHVLERLTKLVDSKRCTSRATPRSCAPMPLTKKQERVETKANETEQTVA